MFSTAIATTRSRSGERFGGNGPVESQAPEHGREQTNVVVGNRAFDGEGGFGADPASALEHPAKGIALLRVPIGEVGQGSSAHSRVLTPAFETPDIQQLHGLP